MKVFAERLKRLRKSTGLSQMELAERIGVSQTAISDYEGDRKEPTAPVIMRIADFFSVSADYLLGLTDDPSPKGDGLSPVIKQKLERLEKLESEIRHLKDIVRELLSALENLE